MDEEVIEYWENNDGTVQAAFMCPGCNEYHAPRIKGSTNVWGFNNSKTKPTFTPSILVRWTEGEGEIKKRCHSFVTDGQIRFLEDCTHELKGQTVALEKYSS